jgi:hypothetical protein
MVVFCENNIEQVHLVDKIHSFFMLMQVVHIKTTGL